MRIARVQNTSRHAYKECEEMRIRPVTLFTNRLLSGIYCTLLYISKLDLS